MGKLVGSLRANNYQRSRNLLVGVESKEARLPILTRLRILDRRQFNRRSVDIHIVKILFVDKSERGFLSNGSAHIEQKTSGQTVALVVVQFVIYKKGNHAPHREF